MVLIINNNNNGTCDFWVSDSMRAVYLCARSAHNVQREAKHRFSFIFTFVHAFFTFCSCLFHSCLSHRNKTRENCDGCLQRGIASLFLDLRLSDKTCDFCQSPFFPCDLAFQYIVSLQLNSHFGLLRDSRSYQIGRAHV